MAHDLRPVWWRVPSAKVEDRAKTMSPAVSARADATVQLVEALYWGIRVMVDLLLQDAPRIQRANGYLRALYSEALPAVQPGRPPVRSPVNLLRSPFQLVIVSS